MLNKSGITKETFTNVRQILADVENQSGVGCIVAQSLGVTVGTRRIVKAGTPININLENLQTPAKAPAAAADSNPAVPMNAVLIHDVDVTNGNANGSALIFGFINLNRLDSDVVTLVTAARAITGASPLLTFVKQ